MILEEIDNNYVLEDSEHETKARLDRDNILGWLKTIDGFANGKGGTLYVGVEDKTGTLIGFDEKEIDSEKLFFYKTLNEHMDVIPPMQVETIPYKVRDKNRFILKIKILQNKEKPFILKYQQMPLIYVRRDGYTSPVTVEEMLLMIKKHASPTFDTQKTDIPFVMDDFKKLAAFYEERADEKLTEKKLAAINFFDENKNLNKGALLFKDDYSNKNNLKITCSTYKGYTRGDDVIISSESFNGNLIDSLKFIWDYVQLRMNHGFIKKETSHIDFISYPNRALFEGIINALAHRDYLIDGSQVSVDLFINRLVITSPGSILGVEELPPTHNISSLVSKRRNTLICDTFILCDAMEARGTGFEKIAEEYKDADLEHKPYIFSKYNQFALVLPDLTFENGINVDEDMIRTKGGISNESKFDMQVLVFCLNKPKTVTEICSYLHISNSTYFRNQILDNLIKQGYLISKKDGKRYLFYTNKDNISLS